MEKYNSYFAVNRTWKIDTIKIAKATRLFVCLGNIGMIAHYQDI